MFCKHYIGKMICSNALEEGTIIPILQIWKLKHEGVNYFVHCHITTKTGPLFHHWLFSGSHIQFSSVTQSCPTLWDPMDCSTGFPVYHQLPELAQIHVHRVDDAIQPSHPLPPPSPRTFNPSQNQGLFKWVSSSHQWSKYWSFSFSISPSNEYSRLISFWMD